MARQDLYDDSTTGTSSDIPFSAMGNNLHIEMFGDSKLSIDGCFTIFEYAEESIKLKFKKRLLEILGFNLIINNVSDENLLITGKIISLEFTE